VAGVLKIPDSALLPVAAVFLKLILVMLFNRKYIHVFKTNYYRAGHPRIALGDGMYLAGSLINHACDPSIYQVSYGTHAVYRARRPIETGEQLTDCYIMSAANEGYIARQLNNAQHFRFHCK
jgi:SET domain